jgi:uncharacterized membrane-anchored protein YhcB (DUF1043 family)
VWVNNGRFAFKCETGCPILNLTVIGLIIGCVLGYLMDRLCDISLNNIKKIHGNDNVWNIKDK